MTHSYHEGLHCSCCSPVSKTLTAKVKLSAEYIFQHKVAATAVEDLIIACGLDEEGNITAGTIQTMAEGESHEVEAIAIRDGKILYAGSLGGAKTALGGSATNIRILKKNETVLPGLVDPHLHILPTVVLNTWADCSPFKDGQQELTDGYNREMALDAVSEHCYVNDEHSKCWKLGSGIDPSLFNKTNVDTNINASININAGVDSGSHTDSELNRQVLDSKFPHNPVFILNASMHIAYVNQQAIDILRQKGLKELAKKIEENDGLVLEAEEILPFVESVLPMPSGRDFKKSLKKFLCDATSRGVTYILDAGTLPSSNDSKDSENNQPEFLYQLAKNDRCPVRIGAALVAEDLEGFNDNIAKQYEPIKDNAEITCPTANYESGKKYEFFSIPFVKVLSDGSNQGLTGYQSADQPYLCNSNYEPTKKGTTGIFNFSSFEDFKELIQAIAAADWPVMIHANGNQAVRNTLEALALVDKGSKKADTMDSTSTPPMRRMEHASLLNQDDICKMQSLNLSPSFLIGHVGYWGAVFQSTIFGKKSEHLDLCKSTLSARCTEVDKNIRITLHSDNSVTPIGPLRMMDQAVHRVMEADKDKAVLNKAERLTPLEALRAVTYDAAWQCHVGDLVGSLEVGKCADFVILAENPLAMKNTTYNSFRKIPVLETYKGGIKYDTQKLCAD